MWNRAIYRCIESVRDMWYKLRGMKKHFMRDPLFGAIIDMRFKQRILYAGLWTTPVLAQRLVVKCGVCPHVSVMSGEFVLDPSISRETLLSGYAAMCIAVGSPRFEREYTNNDRYLTMVHFANAPLPEEWTRTSSGYWYGNLLESQMIQRLLESEITATNRVQNLMRGQMRDCLISPDTDECSICLEPASEGPWKALVVCGHEFHEECLLKIRRPTCPLCRAVIVVE